MKWLACYKFDCQNNPTAFCVAFHVHIPIAFEQVFNTLHWVHSFSHTRCHNTCHGIASCTGRVHKWWYCIFILKKVISFYKTCLKFWLKWMFKNPHNYLGVWLIKVPMWYSYCEGLHILLNSFYYMLHGVFIVSNGSSIYCLSKNHKFEVIANLIRKNKWNMMLLTQ